MSEGTLINIYAFPSLWPPIKPFEISSSMENDVSVKLTADELGRLILVLSTEMFSREICSQPIDFQGEKIGIISVRWKSAGDQVDFRINGILLKADGEAQGSPLIIVNKNSPREKNSQIIENFSIPQNVSRAEKTFLLTTQDIQQKLLTCDPYQIDAATGLLRKLFIDQDPLYNIVNRSYQLRVFFEIVPPSILDVKSLTSHVYGLDPSGFPNARVEKIKLQDFLKTACLVLKQHEYTVLEVIKFGANSKGSAVHFGQAEHPILTFDGLVSLMGLEPSTFLFSNICRVCLRALVPLKDAILDKYRSVA